VLQALIAAATIALAPAHATVVAAIPGGGAVVRFDPITLTIPALTRRVRFEPAHAVTPGVGVDAILDRNTQPWTLRNAVDAGEFSPGVPEPGRVIPIDLGYTLPPARLIDQNGKLVRLDRAFAGKTVVLSFIFTRCPDRSLCPAISGKFAYMQSRLDPARFALVEITLDPPYDSPAVLRRYGQQYGEDPRVWTLLTGTGGAVKHVLDEFKITSLRISSSDFLHSDRLFVVAPNGRVAFIAETGGWDPDGVLSEARSVAGMSSNPFERAKLSLIASIVAFCGGSQFAGIVFLEMGLFFIITAIVITSLWMVARVLWRKEGA